MTPRSGLALAGLTALALTAFAANSVLNRMAVAGGAIDPMSFAAIRVVAGAALLAGLVAARSGALRLGRAKPWAVAGLSTYMVAFSLAYIALGAGPGALILFGGVQVAMFAAAIAAREDVTPARWVGTALALAGLVWLLLPAGLGDGPAGWAFAMAAASIGWAVYTLVGRGATDPLAETAANFALTVPVMLAALAAALLAGAPMTVTLPGAVLAILSGAGTSGLGYALWYAVLPSLSRSGAALSQLTVPVIAAAAGVILLGEAPTARLLGAGALVVLGVAMGLLPRRRGPAARP